jgi:hypothetical protein
MRASIILRFTILLSTSLKMPKATIRSTLSMSLFSGGMRMSYTRLYSKLDGLTGTFHFSKIFPANARQSGQTVSRNALRSSQRRLRESRARRIDA